MQSISEQKIDSCYVCGKIWKRKEVDMYLYFNGMVVCSHHEGAKEWYDGALKLTDAKCKMEGLTLDVTFYDED